MSRIHFFTSLLITLAVLSGCTANNEPFIPPGSSGTTTGIVSSNNLAVIASDLAPKIFDTVDPLSSYKDTTLTITAKIGNNNNQMLAGAHTIYFKTEWGLIEPSCVTVDGQCSVTWETSSYPYPLDHQNTIVAYTLGEESFTDLNGNGTFDDGETFNDIEEPYIDVNENGVYSMADGDIVINVPNGNDPTGTNTVHDIADGFFNGQNCKHSSLCSTTLKYAYVWKRVPIDMNGGTLPPRTIGVTVAGLLGTGLVLQNNGGDDLSIPSDGSYTFATAIDSGTDYAVTVSTQPTGPVQTCTVAQGTGTANANVTDVVVTCSTTTYAVNVNISGITGDSVTLLNNSGDPLTITADGTYAFSTPIADGSTYNVTVGTPPTTVTCTASGGTESGTISGGPVTANFGCI